MRRVSVKGVLIGGIADIVSSVVLGIRFHWSCCLGRI